MRYILTFIIAISCSAVNAHPRHVHSHDNENKKHTHAEKDHHHTHLQHEIETLLDTARRTSAEKDYQRVYKQLKALNTRDPKLLLYLAEVQQHFHEFDAALTTLQRIPQTAASLLLRANIEYTQGKYAASQQSCKALFRQGVTLYALICSAQASALQGQLERSYRLLDSLQQQQRIQDKAALHWLYVNLAEMAERNNDEPHALEFYQKALVLQPDDIPTLIAYTDILLSKQDYQQVQLLTRNHLQHDPLLLRYVRALNLKDDVKNNLYFHQLTHRLIEHKNRRHLHGDSIAEYYYYFTNDGQTAHHWARQHWARQKTPRDARLLARTATRIHDRGSIAMLQKWQKTCGLQDQMLSKTLRAFFVAGK